MKYKVAEEDVSVPRQLKKDSLFQVLCSLEGRPAGLPCKPEEPVPSSSTV